MQISKVESYKNQRHTYVSYQPFPELMSEEHYVHSNYGNYHSQKNNYRCDIFIHS